MVRWMTYLLVIMLFGVLKLFLRDGHVGQKRAVTYPFPGSASRPYGRGVQNLTSRHIAKQFRNGRHNHRTRGNKTGTNDNK